jgi:uncharacterized protein (TIGR02453 family)
MAPRFEGFADTKLTFFRKLAKNQDRDWFGEHKSEYEDGWRAPMEAFLAEARERLDDAYPHLELGEPRVLRIYRDVRFSKDKTPYKTSVAGGVPLKISGKGGSGGMMDAPSALYVHFSIDEGCFAGAGSYHVEGPKLEHLRRALLDETRGGELSKIAGALKKKGFTFAAAETLKKPPKGTPPDHPRADFLKMKGLVVMFPDMPQAELASRAILDWTVKTAKVAAPLVEWLAFSIRA